MLRTLLNSGANMNLYGNPRVSPPYIAIQKGHCNDNEVNICEQIEQTEEKPLSIVARRNVRKKSV